MTQLFRSAANSRLMAGGLVGSTSQLGGMKAAAALPGRQENRRKVGGWKMTYNETAPWRGGWVHNMGVSENRG